jgi:hypothetical protein
MAFASSWRHSKQLAQSFTGTSPKSLSTHMSDRAHMRGRVPRLACYIRG